MKNNYLLFSLLGSMFCIGFAFAQPANDDPCAAIQLTLNVAVSGSCQNATVLPGEVGPPNAGDCYTDWCDGTLDGSVWYTFTAPSSGNIVLTSCSSNNMADTQFALWDADDCLDFMTYTLLAANDDKPNCVTGFSEYASEISYCGLNAGSTYYLQVDGYFGDVSPFEITAIDPGACPNYCFFQFVHSSPDANVQTIDIRIDGALVADNLAFGAATPFIQVNNIMNPYITFNPANSIDDSNPYFDFTTSFESQKSYVVPIIGILDVMSYDISETGAYFTITGTEVATGPNNPSLSQITFINTVTDVSGLRYYFDGVDAFPNGLVYSEIRQDEYTLPNLSYEVYDINNPSHYGRFNIPFDQYVGESITILTTGFVSPPTNNNGPELSMCVVRQDGTVNCYPDLLSIEENEVGFGIALSPNPANNYVKVNFTENTEQLEILITDITGKVIYSKPLSSSEMIENELMINTTSLSQGTYYISLLTNKEISIPEALVITK